MNPEKLPGIAGLKSTLRQQMRTRLALFSGEERAALSLEICRRASSLPSFREGRAISLFAPLPTEPDIALLAEEAWAKKKRVAFPLMSRRGDAPHLDWFAVAGWEDLILAGPFGIREPDPAVCARVDPLELDCIFAPGLAFDLRGHRLGRGGGYYDAALAQLDIGTPRIGLMFACQQAQEVPRDAHDQILELIVTEAGVVEVG